MKKITPYCLFLTFIVVSTFVASTAAQDRYSAPDLVRKTRGLKVSTLEKRMPAVGFDDWFRKALGKNPQLTWSVEDCQSGGTPNFNEIDHDHRLCVVAEGLIAEQMCAVVSIEYTKLVDGKPAGPVLERVTVGVSGTRYGYEPGVLAELPERIAKIQRSLVFVDPRNGEFFISDLKQYEGIMGMWIDTTRSSRGRAPNVWRKGGLDTIRFRFPSVRNYYDGKRWSFTTITIKGISFKFDGKFEKTRLREYGDAEGDHILKGHMIKFIKGKIFAESDLTFTFDVFHDAP